MAVPDTPDKRSSHKPATRRLDDTGLWEVTGGEAAEHCRSSQREQAKLFINQVIRSNPPPKKR